VGILFLQPGDDGESFVAGVARAEDQLEVGIVLAEEAFEIFFEARFEAVDGLEKADGRREVGYFARKLRTEANDRLKGEDEESGGAKESKNSGVKKDVSEGEQREIVMD